MAMPATETAEHHVLRYGKWNRRRTQDCCSVSHIGRASSWLSVRVLQFRHLVLMMTETQLVPMSRNLICSNCVNSKESFNAVQGTTLTQTLPVAVNASFSRGHSTANCKPASLRLLSLQKKFYRHPFLYHRYCHKVPSPCPTAPAHFTILSVRSKVWKLSPSSASRAYKHEFDFQFGPNHRIIGCILVSSLLFLPVLVPKHTSASKALSSFFHVFSIRAPRE